MKIAFDDIKIIEMKKEQDNICYDIDANMQTPEYIDGLATYSIRIATNEKAVDININKDVFESIYKGILTLLKEE